MVTKTALSDETATRGADTPSPWRRRVNRLTARRGTVPVVAARPGTAPDEPREAGTLNGSAILLGVLIAIAVVLYAIHAPVLGAGYDAGAAGMLLAFPASAGVVMAWRNPRAGVGVVLLGVAATAIAVSEHIAQPFPWTVPSMLAMFVCCLLMGYQVPLRQAALTYGAMFIISTLVQSQAGSYRGVFFVAIWLSLVMTALGAGVRRLRDSEARAQQQEKIGAQERERREVLEEKAKIARELHDVVAHHMSVISVQAASAEYRIPDLPQQAREEFQVISAQSRSSLAELRRILGVLRGDDETLQLAPQPGTDDLPRIIEHVRRAGTPVELISADLNGLDESTSIAVYRIVQEALSNVVRHAAGATARVVITRAVGSLEIIVSNPPAPPVRAVTDTRGTGHGILGMRERASMLGGTLSAGPTAGGGFEVRAWLPLDPANERDSGYTS